MVLSVLYSPFDEVDLGEPYGALPEDDYLDSILDQAGDVEHDLADETRVDGCNCAQPAGGRGRSGSGQDRVRALR